MDSLERQEFFKFAKKLDETDWALPWANEFYLPDSYNGIEEFKSDISFASELEEDARTGILAPKRDDMSPKIEVYYPLRVVIDFSYSISAEGIENFLKGRLRFGDSDHINIINAYSYLKLFEKYLPFRVLRIKTKPF